MERKKRPRSWSYHVGPKGSRVTVYERSPNGSLYARCWDPRLARGLGGYRRVALRHRDREAARRYANEQLSKLHEALSDLTAGRLTVAQLFTAYRQHRSPQKMPKERREDERRSALWTACLGSQREMRLALTRERWESLIAARVSGALDSRGRPIPEDNRRPVRARAVERDCAFLKAVCRWATSWRNESGRPLLAIDPCRGLPMPAEKNVRRPVCSQDRYEMLVAVADQVAMERRWDGHRREMRSYLPELLVLAHGTGRRLAAIAGLRFDDLRLAATPEAPHGAIRWRAETDKQRREQVVPITPGVRAALEGIMQVRPGIGPAPLFPSAEDSGRPVSKDRARRWLLEAEKLAGLEHMPWGGFHAFRRGWASSRKHLPAPDVAAAGGWGSTEALMECYQQADPATVLSVVLSPAQLREVRAG